MLIPPPPPIAKLHGIDVSVYQGAVDWHAVKTAGKVFAICRFGCGLAEPDARFTANWAGIAAAGLVRGAYLVLEPNSDPAKQAVRYWQLVAPRDGDMRPILDCERGKAGAPTAAQVQVAVDTMAGLSGLEPIVYACRADWETVYAGLARCLRWVADYSEVPTVPYDLWQHIESGAATGVGGPVDLDVFFGTAEQFAARLCLPRAQEAPSMPTGTDWASVPAPGSYDELYAHYGDPRHPDFEARYIVSSQHAIAGGKIVTVRSHVAIAGRLHNVWQHLTAAGALMYLKSYDGCYVVRNIRGASRPSLHSWGLAIDLNAAEFPLGSKFQQPAALREAFAAEGFVWGGDFAKRKDPMHWQWSKPHTI